MIYFRFHSNTNRGHGFLIEYNALGPFFTECGGNYSNASGILTSPMYPNAYPHLTGCIYHISQPKGTFINVSFISMDINCNVAGSNYIEMRDGKSESSPLMAKFCGNESSAPAFMETTQDSLYIKIR